MTHSFSLSRLVMPTLSTEFCISLSQSTSNTQDSLVIKQTVANKQTVSGIIYNL